MKLQVYYCILIIESLISCTPQREIPEIYGKEDALTTYEGSRNILLDAECFFNTVPPQVHTKEQTKALHTLGRQIPPIITQLMERGSINKQLPDNLPNKTIKEYTLITMK